MIVITCDKCGKQLVNLHNPVLYSEYTLHEPGKSDILNKCCGKYFFILISKAYEEKNETTVE